VVTDGPLTMVDHYPNRNATHLVGCQKSEQGCDVW
jgi:hypothetical protein